LHGVGYAGAQPGVCEPRCLVPAQCAADADEGISPFADDVRPAGGDGVLCQEGRSEYPVRVS
jgi:hypothetical protein